MLDNYHTIESYPVKLQYPGAFHPNVEKKILELIKKCFVVHLFSGSSKIGNIRVDISHKNATNKENVYDFCQKPLIAERERVHKMVLLMDPNYSISRKNLKLKIHGIKENLSGNVLAHKVLVNHINLVGYDEILLLDYASPTFPNYEEIDFWRVKTGGWQNNRTLTHYRRKTERIDIGS